MRCIGIIGAMDDEVAGLKEYMQDVKITRKASMDFYEGILEGRRAVVVRSGIGKVNAAVCAQILVDEFQAEMIINTGIAGSLNNEINIGDIVVSTDLVQHDMNAVAFGYPAGQIPQMDVFSFQGDEVLRKVAVQACREVNPDIQVFEGRIASGDQFVADQGVKDFIVKDGNAADPNLWFAPLDMERDSEIYYQARKEAWVDIHGSLTHFDGDGFVREALEQCRRDSRAVTAAYMGDEMAGIIQLATERDREQGVGYIPFFYMLPNRRRQGLGVQLLGEAVSVYRPMGRDRLRLRCAPDNHVAQRFYKRYGFRKIGQAQGTRVPLDLMEKYIGYEPQEF